MKRLIVSSIVVVGLVMAAFAAGTSYLYLHQERRIFATKPLAFNYQFYSNYPFKEIYLEARDGAQLHGLHYRAPQSRGVVLYFHGRGRNLSTEGNRVAKDFASRGYDVFVVDYRGFGKSRGEMSFPMLLSDATLFYKHLLEEYDEKQITVYGRSLGTGVATYIASTHKPERLILETPYFSLQDQVGKSFPLVPKFLIPYVLKYPIRTDLWIQRVQSPIFLIHGTKDRVIAYDASTRLQRLLQHRTDVHLTLIQGGTHSTIHYHPAFNSTLDEILTSG